MSSNLVEQRGWRHPLPLADFPQIRLRLAIEAAYENMVIFMFGQTRQFVRRAVGEAKHLMKVGVKTEFFAQTPLSGVKGRLAPPRVTAAGVGPEPTEVVFARSAFLQEKLAPGVENVNGKCPVKFAAVLMSGELGTVADRIVLLIDEDEVISSSQDHLDIARP